LGVDRDSKGRQPRRLKLFRRKAAGTVALHEAWLRTVGKEIRQVLECGCSSAAFQALLTKADRREQSHSALAALGWKLRERQLLCMFASLMIRLKTRAFWFGTLVVLLGVIAGGGCSFGRAWRKAAAVPTTVSDLEGRW